MEDFVTGIKEDELGVLGLEIADYADRVSEILDRIDSTMERLPSHYQGPPCDKVIARYNELRQSYSAVKNNIKNCSDDLITLITKMRENDRVYAGMAEGYTEETLHKIRTENINLE